MKSFYIIFFFFLLFLDVSAQQVAPGTWSYRTGPDGTVTVTKGVSGYHDMTSGWNSDPFEQFRYHDGSSDPDNNVHRMNFRLLPPKGYIQEESQKYPMIVFLHGLGEAAVRDRPNDSFSTYSIDDKRYLNNDHTLYHGGKAHLAAVNRDLSHYRSFPGFVLFPQNQKNWDGTSRDFVITILSELIKKYNIDPNRIYLAGLSDGALAVWELMQKRPDLFAAALPMSWVPLHWRINNVYDVAKIAKIVHIPLWHFQGERDGYPKVSWARELQGVLRDAGGTPRYTEYPKVGHATWNKAIAEKEYFSWMLGRNKTDLHVYHGDSLICEGEDINVRLGLSAGFEEYEWKTMIDGSTSIFSTGTVNEITAEAYGSYSVRIRRNTDWTDWSKPLTIQIKEPTVAAEITALGSTTLPGLDNANSVELTVLEEYETYVWFKDENLLEGVDFSGNTITVADPGSYTVVVTETDGCESLPSEPMIVTKDAPIDLIKPENLIAEAVSATKINLFWDDLETDELGYEVYRSTSPGNEYAFIIKTGKDAINFQDTGLLPGTTYYYIIRGVNDSGRSPSSNEASAVTDGDNLAPTIPGNLVKTGSTDISISLAWQPSTDNVGVYQYLVYSNGEVVGTTADTNITVEGLTPETLYSFTVTAKDLIGNESDPSNEITAVTIFEGLIYRYYEGGDEEGVWAEVADYEGSDIIKTGSIDNFDISLISQGGVRPDYQLDYYAFDFEGYLYIENAGDYQFQLRAASGSILYLDGNEIVNNDGNHEDRTESSGIVTLNAGAHKILVKYFDHVMEEVLEVSYSGPDTDDILKLIPDEALRSGAEYSDPPAAPTELNATLDAVIFNQINLSWSDVSTENQYKIFRSLNAAGPFNIIHTSAVNEKVYEDKGLNGEIQYFYKVKATNQHGESEFALPASGTVKGLDYAYYEGSWDMLPYFPNLEAIKSGVLTNFLIDEKEENDDFAFKFDGLINITTPGDYVFYTESDDGSKLYIIGEEVVNNDGLHPTEEKSGTINLSVGLHPITVNYFEKDRGEGLNVKYEMGLELPKGIIPESVLFLPVVTATTSADMVAPSIPDTLRVMSINENNISLSWSASTDNVGVVAYKVNLYFNDPDQPTANARVAAMPDREEITTETSYKYSGLVANTTYYFTVAAKDAAGNTSEESETVSATTFNTSAMPVEFLHFSGEFVNGKVALLWATAGETNNDYFTIERSAGFDNFEPIATMDGAGNSSLVVNYAFTDAKPFNGLNYYRVKQTDYNGDHDYSRIIMVDCRLEGSALSAQVYPVPAKGNELYLAVKLLNQNNTVNLQISDIYGKLIQVEHLDPAQLQLPYNLFSHRAYSKGLYVIIIEQAGVKVYKKFIVN